MSDEFDRIKRLPPYVFAEVNRLKAELRAKGKDIIDFGMGNPDMPTPKHIREKLKETVEKPKKKAHPEIKGLIILAWTLFLALAHFSFIQDVPGSNFIGLVIK